MSNWIADKLRAEQGEPAPDPDAGLADRIAAALREEHAASLRPAAPRPPAAPVPDWLFGPRHRELDAQRRAAAEATRRAPPPAQAAQPAAPALPRLCPCCLQPMPPRSEG